MYELQYIKLQKYRQEFNCEINIVVGDTDSFFLECKYVSLKDQLLPAMIRDELLDTSNYPTTHPLYSAKFTNCIGKFKDESGGIEDYSDWVFLRPKLYSLQNSMKAKGINLQQTRLTHQDYVNELNTCNEATYVKQRRIGTDNHQLYTYECNKVALSARDDKRHWLNANDSVAYGHYLTY